VQRGRFATLARLEHYCARAGRGAVARLLLTGRDRVFSVFPSVGVAAFSAGLAAFGTGLAADGAGESLVRCDRGDGHGGGHYHGAG
jgi:hypothetical protein